MDFVKDLVKAFVSALIHVVLSKVDQRFR